jgi:hypothetical protein
MQSSEGYIKEQARKLSELEGAVSELNERYLQSFGDRRVENPLTV